MSRIRPIFGARARALAAALALGTAAPLTAQPAEEPSFAVLPPRPLRLPQVRLDPTSPEIPIGFFTASPSPVAPHAPVRFPQVSQNRPWWITAPQSQSALSAAQAAHQQRPPATGSFHLQPLTGGVPKPKGYPALTAPMAAPAWRWHGYGSVTSGDAQPTTPGAAISANPNLHVPDVATAPPIGPGPAAVSPTLPMPATMPMPVGEPNNPSSPVALPSYSPQPTATEFAPFPAGASGGASWKPSEPLSVLPSNPMTADPAIVPAVATERVGWTPTGPAMRQVKAVESSPPAEPTVRPAHFVPAPAAPVPATAVVSLTGLHTAIEKLLAGQGRDLELYRRNESSLLVRFKVAQAANAEPLANAISKLPGAAAFQIVYEISVAP